MIVAVTGHRPDKLGGYSSIAFERLIKIAKHWFAINEPKEVIVGMALGWDQACALAAIQLGIRVHAAIPFINQQSVWHRGAREQYDYILQQCYKRTVVCEGEYAAWKMQKRNEWMVDRCDLLLECFRGDQGGTFNCDKYARARGVKIVNLYDKLKPMIIKRL